MTSVDLENAFLWTEPQELTDKGLRHLVGEFRGIRDIVASYGDEIAERTCAEIDAAIEVLLSEARRRGIKDPM